MRDGAQVRSRSAEPRPGSGPTAGAVAYAALATCAQRLRETEARVLRGEDPEAVHAMRVATRRLRAALAVFAPALSPRAASLRAGARRLGRALGEVRDLEVHLRHLEALEPSDWEHPGARWLAERTRGRHAKAGAALRRTIEGSGYRRMIRTLELVVRAGPPEGNAVADAPAGAVLPGLLWPVAKKVRSSGDALGSAAPPEDFHRLRRRARKLRYALEMTGPLYGRKLARPIAALIALQDALGERQDAEVARGFALAAISRRPVREVVLGLGGLARREDAREEAATRAFRAAWKRFRGQPWDLLAGVLAPGVRGGA